MEPPVFSTPTAVRVTAPTRVNTGPFGETIANEHRPELRASQS